MSISKVTSPNVTPGAAGPKRHADGGEPPKSGPKAGDKQVATVAGTLSDAATGAKGAAKALGSAAAAARSGEKQLRTGATTALEAKGHTPKPGTMPPRPEPPFPGPRAPHSSPIPRPLPPMDETITRNQEAEIRATLAGHGFDPGEIDRIIEQLADGAPVGGMPPWKVPAAGGLPGSVGGMPGPALPGNGSIFDQLNEMVASLNQQIVPVRPR